MNDAKMPFLHLIFPRIKAAIFVLLLIGSLSLVGVGGVALIGPILVHGNNIEHVEGQIVSVGPGRDFVLETTAGHHMFFQCGEECRASPGHMQRHLHERAHTDVYYVQASKNTLLALDVD